MKVVYASIISLCFTFMQTIVADPLLAIVIMVKNEQHSICPTLDPFIKAGVQSFFIYDTGSEDETISTITKHFEENNVGDFHIIQEPFINFAESRNKALELAREAFPEANFFLMPDAEWYIQNVPALLEFCESQRNTTMPSFFIRIKSEDNDFVHARLFRAHAPVRFIGAVHEYPVPLAYIEAPSTYFRLQPSCIGHKSSAERWHRDYVLLLKEYEKDPKDPRTLFYLAQTCHCVGRLEESERYYTERLETPSFPEEDFMTRYRLGFITELLAREGKRSWEDAMKWYLEAYSMRPTRAEPLVKIAEHYITKDLHHIGYIFAKMACELPYPTQDMLFIDKYYYTCYRHELLSRAAWHTGRFSEGELAALKALYTDPDQAHLKRNAALFMALCNP